MRYLLTKTILIFAASLLLVSCKNDTNNKNGIILASCGDEYLYFNDIKQLFEGTSQEDSLKILDNYIKQWTISKLLYQKALLNIENTDELDMKVQEYKEDLYIYQYEQILAAQKLDQGVKDEEIEAYFNKHMKDFTLNEDIVKPVYIELSKEIEDIKDVKKWFNSNSPEDLDKLKEFCFRLSTKFFFAEEWVKISILTKETPFMENEVRDAVFKKKSLLTEDSKNYYFLKIVDFKKKSSEAPYEFIKKDIKTIILHKRKKNLIYNTRNKIYSDALEKNKIKTYHKE